jgi:hypothetical protein
MVAACLDCADDYLELQVRIALIKVQFEIRRRIVISEIHGAPFNVENAASHWPFD